MIHIIENKQVFCDTVKMYMKQVNRLLDIGCGIKPQNYIHAKEHICCEPYHEYVNHLVVNKTENQLIIQADWEKAIEIFPNNMIDSIFVIDVIEHIDKNDALKLLSRSKEIVSSQMAIFTPYGFVEQCEDDEYDGWGLGGQVWQQHKSGWTEADFNEEWEIFICPHYHNRDNYDRLIPEPFGAMWAIYTKADGDQVKYEKWNNQREEVASLFSVLTTEEIDKFISNAHNWGTSSFKDMISTINKEYATPRWEGHLLLSRIENVDILETDAFKELLRCFIYNKTITSSHINVVNEILKHQFSNIEFDRVKSDLIAYLANLIVNENFKLSESLLKKMKLWGYEGFTDLSALLSLHYAEPTWECVKALSLLLNNLNTAEIKQLNDILVILINKEDKGSQLQSFKEMLATNVSINVEMFNIIKFIDNLDKNEQQNLGSKLNLLDIKYYEFVLEVLADILDYNYWDSIKLTKKLINVINVDNFNDIIRRLLYILDSQGISAKSFLSYLTMLDNFENENIISFVTELKGSNSFDVFDLKKVKNTSFDISEIFVRLNELSQYISFDNIRIKYEGTPIGYEIDSDKIDDINRFINYVVLNGIEKDLEKFESFLKDIYYPQNAEISVVEKLLRNSNNYPTPYYTLFKIISEIPDTDRADIINMIIGLLKINGTFKYRLIKKSVMP